jgi:hypothetical protein
MSQFSDIYSSSIYDGDPAANDPFHPSLNEPLPTTKISRSQQSFDTTLNSGFLTPVPPPLIPPSLQRVGPGRSTAFVLFDEMSKDDFVTWWLETDFGKTKKINWGSIRTAKCWEHFDQVADAKTGKPGAKCRKCHKVLDHPGNSRYGTTALNRHIAGPTCKNSTTQKGNIKGLLANAVCYFNYSMNNN